ncbi:MAG TPA: hypothetical protein VMV38_00680 [Candidatus Paceibacterota bacterium]|nr:hypothetical protein [Candidatus Paceibacterota bacterium]
MFFIHSPQSKKILLVAVFAIASMTLSAHAAPAPTATLQSQLDSNTQAVAQLNQEIAKYEAEIAQAGSDKKTLQSAIDALNLQRKAGKAKILVTQHQIAATQLQIKQLGYTIATTQDAISTGEAALGENIRSLERVDSEPLIMQLFSSENLSQVWIDADNTIQVQSAVQNKVRVLDAQKIALADSQDASKQKQSMLAAQKNVLTSKQQALSTTEKTKSQLLSETAAKESNYQKLLAAAKAELASFSTFATNAGGSGLLANQTQCDAWGCYYNQRDAAWGNDPLNGTHYLLKSDGCLVTAMAMVMTHYGYHDVTPVTINADPGNFAAYYPAYLLLTITVDGKTVSRKTATIDAILATGNPVVVGIHAYGGTHYVVLTSGSNGEYRMRDPYIPNATDVSFTAHYSLRSIFGVSKIVIS